MEIEDFGTRAVVDNSTTSGGAFQNPSRPDGAVLATMDRMPRIADLMPHGNTTNNSIEYVQDTTAAGGGVAAEVAEGSAKPESTYTFVVVTEPVRTVAHWMNITRQAADDNNAAPRLPAWAHGLRPRVPRGQPAH